MDKPLETNALHPQAAKQLIGSQSFSVNEHISYGAVVDLDLCMKVGQRP